MENITTEYVLLLNKLYDIQVSASNNKITSNIYSRDSLKFLDELSELIKIQTDLLSLKERNYYLHDKYQVNNNPQPLNNINIDLYFPNQPTSNTASNTTNKTNTTTNKTITTPTNINYGVFKCPETYNNT